MTCVLVVAPHPDDETLGAGGTLLAHRDAGDEVHWMIVTEMHPEQGFPDSQIALRSQEIAEVSARYGFGAVHSLGFAASSLDAIPRSAIVADMAETVDRIRPEVVYLPHPGDAHTDHRDSFEAAAAAIKPFRAPSVRAVYTYETLSETGANPLPDRRFSPTTYFDISSTLDEKADIMALYASELGDHPFPRSHESIQALATIRGAESSFVAAEAFMLLWERRTIG